MKALKFLSVLAAATLASQFSASAGVITWSDPAAVTTPDATFLTIGAGALTEIGAEAWGGGNTTVMSNGISIFFQQGTANGSNAFATTSGSFGVTSGNASGYTNADANLQTALGDFEFDGVQTLTFNNLTVGQTYVAQIFGLDQRSFATTLQQFYQDTDGGAASPNITLGLNQYEFGTFIATDTTQSLTVNNPNQNGSTGTPETNLNAVVLYTATPEPATMLLAGLGLVGLGVARRRRTVR